MVRGKNMNMKTFSRGKAEVTKTEQKRVRVIVTHRIAHRPLSRVNILFSFLAGLCFLFNSFPAYGKGGDITWQYGDAKAGKQEATAVVTDASGNVIVTGYQNTSGDTDDNYYTVKFNGDGSGVIWTAPYDKAGGSDVATAIAVDSDGNIIVTGHVSNGLNSDIHTIKYNGATGAVLWQHTYNGASNGNDYGVSVAVDSLNNIYVGGYTQTASNNDDIIIIKYDSLYPEYPSVIVTPIWTEVFGSTGTTSPDRATSITAGTGGIAVTGYSWNGSNFDYLTRKYGFDKTFIWEKVYAGTASGDDRGLFVKMDAAGNVIVTGYSANSSNHDIYTVKYNGASGAIEWEKTYDGGDEDEPAGLYVFTTGDVYVTGFTRTLTSRYRFYTVRYSGAAGAEVWAKTFTSGGDNDDIPTAIVADESGDIFVTGHTFKASTGDRDFQTIKYKEEDGIQLWQFGFDGAAHKDERPVGIVLSPSGEPIVAGWSDKWTAGASDYDYYVIKYDPGLLNAPAGLTATAITNTQVSLSWTDNSDNEDGFDIWRKLGESGTYEKIGTVGPNVTVYSDATGLSADNYYFYKIRAFNSVNGNSHFSNEAHVLTRVVSYDAPAWSYIYNNPDNGDDIAKAIAVGPDDNPVVTGYSFSEMGGFDYYTVKLNRANAAVLWSERYDDADSEQDDANCIAVDNDNNAIVSGFSSLYGGGAMNTNDIYTIKYPSSGSPELWHSQYNGPSGGDDRATAVATKTDGSGNVAIVGYGKNASNDDDIYVLKYAKTPSLDMYGNAIPAWAASPYDGLAQGNDYPSAVAFDSAGNVYITGYSHNGSNYDFFTAKYDAATGERLWTDIFPGTGSGNDQAESLAVDSSGNVYVTGYVLNASGNEDFYTIKYNGATGARIWEKPYDGPGHGNDEAVSVRIDPIDGAVIVAGTSLTSAGNNDFHIIRYSAESGAVIWERNFERHDNDDYISAMEIDASGYIYVAGNTNNGTNMDILSVIYDYEGNYLDAILFDRGSDDYASSLTVNYQGEAFIAGYSRNASGNADYVVLKQKHDFILIPAPLTLTPQADYSKMNLAWRNNSPGTSFRIERTLAPSTPSSTWTLIYTAPSGTISYQDTGLNFSTNYCYRIDAFSGSLSSRKVEVCTTTTLHSPVWNSVIAVSTTQINLSWQDVTGNTGYKIERKAGSGSWSDLTNLAAGVTTYSDTGLTCGTTYTYRVSALSASGYSLPGDERSTIALPCSPTLAGPTGMTTTGMTVSWGAVTGAANYTMQYKLLSGGAYANYGPCSGIAAVSCSVTDLDSGKQYFFTVKATNASGDSAWSNEVNGFTLPTAPTISSVTRQACSSSGNSSTTATINWGDVTGETGYYVEYAYCNQSSNNPANCATTSGYWIGWYSAGSPAQDATTWPYTMSLPGYAYRFRVYSTVNSGNTKSSVSGEGAVWACMAPLTQNAITPISTTSLSVSWTNIHGNTNYEVQRQICDGICSGDTCSSVGGYSPVQTLSYNDASWTDTGLTQGTSYSYKIRAYNTTTHAGLTAPPDVLSNEKCLSTPPPAPDTVTLSNVTSGQVTLNWQNQGSGQYTGYVIERSINSNDNPGTDSNAGNWGGWTAVKTITDPGTLTYTDTGLTAGYGYKYRVKAAYGSSSYTATTVEKYTRTIPSTPSMYSLSPTPDSPTQISAYWYDVSGNTGFKLDWKEKSGSDCSAGTWNTVDQVSTSCYYNYTFYQYLCSYSTTALTEGKTYCYRIMAYNSVGSSSYSSASARMTLLSPPTLNTLSGITSTKIDLSWSRVTGNAGYKIERKAGAGGTWAQLATTASNVETYTDNSLTSPPGTAYYYRVYTKNTENYSSVPSNEKYATTGPAQPVVTLTASSPSQVTLSWQVVYSATTYKIDRKLGPAGVWSRLTDLVVDYQQLYCNQIYPIVGCLTLSPITTTYTDSGLTENSTYCYQVTAYGAAAGDSDPSTEQCLTTSDLATPVLAGSALSATMVQLSWTYNPNSCTPQPCRADIDGVELEFKLPGGQWSNIVTTGATATSFVDKTGINPNSQYNYRARAYKGVSKSAYSAEVPVTTPAYTTGDVCY